MAKLWRPLWVSWTLALLLQGLVLSAEETSPRDPTDGQVPGKYGAGLDPNG